MRSLMFVATVLVLAACSRKTEPSSGSEAVPASSVAPPAPAENASVSAAPQAFAPSGIAATLSERLLNEAKSRPPILPNADDVLVAFAKVGGGIAAKRQGLAATYKASFCEGGTTSDGTVTLSICEGGPRRPAGDLSREASASRPAQGNRADDAAAAGRARRPGARE